jgi:hypothetical protein
MAGGFSLTEEQKKAFEEILSNKSSISANLNKEVEKFDAFKALIGSDRVLTEVKAKLPFSFAGQALITCDPSNSEEVLIAMANFVKLSGKTPILVLMNYNYKTISAKLKESGLNGGFIIIDTVSKNISDVEDMDDVYFVDSLRNLTQLQIKMLNSISKCKSCAFVFDSLTMLDLYHNEDVAFKFIYSITKLLHKNNLSGFYISSRKSFSQKLAQFYDEYFELKKFL